MNDGKLIDETETLPLVGLGSSPAENPDLAQDLNRRRRRLIRGAAGVAPVLLTLRSGGLLAASSCTGAVTLATTDPTTGQFPGVLGMKAGQICTENFDKTGCPAGENKVLTAADNGFKTAFDGTKWTCENSGTILKNKNIAVLSSGAAHSLGLN
jgi:hypothetical protein